MAKSKKKEQQFAPIQRELTGKEKRQIKKLVTNNCANYYEEQGCLLFGHECPMFVIGYNTTGLCKWFRGALLPTMPDLEAVFTRAPTKKCKQCGKVFPIEGKRVYCSDACAKEARRQQNAARTRKCRAKKQEQ